MTRFSDVAFQVFFDDRLRVAVYADYDHSASDIESADHWYRQVGATPTWPF